MRPALAILTLAGILLGCSTPSPSTSTRLVPHSALSDSSGTLLLVDVCLSYSPLNADDYFVIDPAKQGADALAAMVSQFFEPTDIRISHRLVPFVCGALHDSANTPKRFAMAVDDAVSSKIQPIWTSSELSGDDSYVSALQVLATFAFERALRTNDPSPSPTTHTPEQFRDAATTVARTSGYSALLYLGVTGQTISPGKAAALNVARFATDMALAAAAYKTGPTFTAGNTNHYAVHSSSGWATDRRQMVAALLDLRQSKLLRWIIISASGDPMKSPVLGNPEVLQRLLRHISFSPATK